MGVLPKFITNEPFFRIVDFLGENRRISFSAQEIRSNAHVSKASFPAAWRDLRKYKVVRRLGKGFTLNTKSPTTKAAWHVLVAFAR
jgi:hypothetical protein